MVREDYSEDGSAWDYFPHSQSLSRAYRWGEDGIVGICDNGVIIATVGCILEEQRVWESLLQQP